MSSAILFLAIIAIWACVLIPRWHKRDSAHAAAVAPAVPVAPAASPAMAAAEATVLIAEQSAPEIDEAYLDAPSAESLTEPLTAEESRQRMLAARRRLLLMLIGLEIAAIALALLALAAVWVVIPPSIMIAGYLLLLREAAKADAERAKHEAEAAAHARERARARTLAARRATPSDGMPAESAAAEGAAAAAAKFAAAPVPADYEDAGRDFAPGLAGKYTTSNADADTADDEDYYGGYEAPRLRAVGD